MHVIRAAPVPSATDEGALIEDAQRDIAAFGTLYERYRGGVYAYLRSRTASEEDAADLTQAVFLKALDALSGYQAQRGSFAAWLFRIARNAATDLHRRQRVRHSVDCLPAQLQLGTDPETELLHREALARLRTLFMSLSTDKRELLILRFAAGLTTAEIASVLGMSEAATRKRLSRLVHTLGESYDDA